MHGPHAHAASGGLSTYSGAKERKRGNLKGSREEERNWVMVTEIHKKIIQRVSELERKERELYNSVHAVKITIGSYVIDNH